MLPSIRLLHNVALRMVLCLLVSGCYIMFVTDPCYTSLYLVVAYTSVLYFFVSGCYIVLFMDVSCASLFWLLLNVLTDSRYAFLCLAVTYCGLLIHVILPYIWLLHNAA